MKKNAKKQRRTNDQNSGQNHLFQRGLGRHLYTAIIIRIFVTISYGFILQLSSHFFNHLTGCKTDTFHSESRKCIGQHSTNQKHRENPRSCYFNISDRILLTLGNSRDKSSVQSKSDQTSRTNSESFSYCSSSVSSSI